VPAVPAETISTEREREKLSTMGLGDLSVDEAWEAVKGQILLGWSKTTRRMRAAGAFVVFAYVMTFPD